MTQTKTMRLAPPSLSSTSGAAAGPEVEAPKAAVETPTPSVGGTPIVVPTPLTTWADDVPTEWVTPINGGRGIVLSPKCPAPHSSKVPEATCQLPVEAAMPSLVDASHDVQYSLVGSDIDIITEEHPYHHDPYPQVEMVSNTPMAPAMPPAMALLDETEVAPMEPQCNGPCLCVDCIAQLYAHYDRNMPPPAPPSFGVGVEYLETTEMVQYMLGWHAVMRTWNSQINLPPVPPFPPQCGSATPYSVAFWAQTCVRWWDHVSRCFFEGTGQRVQYETDFPPLATSGGSARHL